MNQGMKKILPGTQDNDFDRRTDNLIKDLKGNKNN